ncbi:hypothetical protein [Dinghuibacter silviterrae]|uniref:Lipoprotein n=1 Tax=Dinghuibacter silviterrae TaxID=1539049 RepID=A0A4R8DRF6_9BACT|nr:hypothetical protein [Dinghuibacter silviterrae]TDW99926.1 hypothetical protein EDB95_0943 [Dinghuibacter silviterrae]
MRKIKKLPGHVWTRALGWGLAVTMAFSSGCHQGGVDVNSDGTRKVVSTQAVASYTQKVNDSLNKEWFFSVQVYETPKPLDYLVQMIYEEMHEVDTVHFPDMGYPIKPAVLKGPDSLTCYVGFLDPKGQFMYYKSVYVENKTLNLRTIRKYTASDTQ